MALVEEPVDGKRGGSVRRKLAGRNPRKRIGWAILFVASAAYIIFAGVPYSSDIILLWITAFLFVSCLGDTGRWRRGIVRDWLPLYLVLVLYDLLRGYASHPLWGPLVRPQVWFDTHLFGGVAPTVQLQRWLYDPHHFHVWDYGAWAVYTSHFFTSFVIAGVLWKRNYQKFRRFVPLFVGLTLLGYITYVLYPAMPPWMASQTGHLAPTVRIIPLVWDHVGLHQAAALFTGGDRFDNNIAAMPSLHAAYPMLICLFFWRDAKAVAQGAPRHLRAGHGLCRGLRSRALRDRRLRRMDLRRGHLRARLQAVGPLGGPTAVTTPGPGRSEGRARSPPRTGGHRSPGRRGDP